MMWHKLINIINDFSFPTIIIVHTNCFRSQRNNRVQLTDNHEVVKCLIFCDCGVKNIRLKLHGVNAISSIQKISQKSPKKWYTNAAVQRTRGSHSSSTPNYSGHFRSRWLNFTSSSQPSPLSGVERKAGNGTSNGGALISEKLVSCFFVDSRTRWIGVPAPTVMTSKQTYRVCFCFQRRFKLAVSEAPEEIKTLFKQYSENGIMSVDQLRRFLIEVQKEDKASREDAQSIIDSIKHFHRTGLNLEGFFKYLFGENPPLSPSPVVIFTSLS